MSFWLWTGCFLCLALTYTAARRAIWITALAPVLTDAAWIIALAFAAGASFLILRLRRLYVYHSVNVGNWRLTGSILGSILLILVGSSEVKEYQDIRKIRDAQAELQIDRERLALENQRLDNRRNRYANTQPILDNDSGNQRPIIVTPPDPYRGEAFNKPQPQYTTPVDVTLDQNRERFAREQQAAEDYQREQAKEAEAERVRQYEEQSKEAADEARRRRQEASSGAKRKAYAPGSTGTIDAGSSDAAIDTSTIGVGGTLGGPIKH